MSSLYEEVKCAFCGAVLSTAGLCPNQYQHTRQRLDAEAATAEGCSRCGFMALTGHDCPEPDAPRAVPLPAEVEAALERVGIWLACPTDGDRVRAHLHHLTAERDALWAECERLRSVGKAKSSTIHALCDTTDEAVRQARIEALEWARGQCRELRQRDGDYEQVITADEIDAEIARLRGLGGDKTELKG